MSRFDITWRLSAVLAAAVFCVSPSLRAQDPGSSGKVSMPIYNQRTKVLEALITGRDSTNLPGGLVLAKSFELRAFRDGKQTNIVFTAQAPECKIDVSKQSAGDSGPIQLFTPTTNLFVSGTGFFFA